MILLDCRDRDFRRKVLSVPGSQADIGMEHSGRVRERRYIAGVLSVLTTLKKQATPHQHGGLSNFPHFYRGVAGRHDGGGPKAELADVLGVVQVECAGF